ncbi:MULTISPECIES: multidrug resistance efflux transporter family protein [Lysobacter]|jgi:drug/metabolite transporter (DMT)-like permease|uniref:multidrug resistance efflux transporter family protein n=1 Tax=Lysobacter TaxID=68 RepID=UPI001F1EA412|nr:MULTISPECIES: multidrug resistance efflux transporter family protein [Lysobacter]UJB19322.1 multidrug resistance efflux transporter family protein [Lysobacter capsici]UJQ26953.1 multidrug resistance efflux transporter family protein [Lysobacter gummosus]
MSASRQALWAVSIALASALFFTCTYVLNRAAANAGGHWAWTAALRYLFTLPMLLVAMPLLGGVRPVWRAIRAHPGPWLLWSGIGFVLFYLCLSYAASSGPSWLVAGTFQLTVIAGMLCAPFLYRDARARIPLPALATGAVIVAGVLLLQLGHGGGRLDRAGWIALVCVAIGAVAYPLGNRGLLLHLEKTGTELNATQRVFGMTLASQPLWWAVALYAGIEAGPPPAGQVALAAGVALGAGVIATVLFFQATGMVRNDPTALAAAEAMQAAEILFATVIGALWLGEAWPQGRALAGACVVMLGIVAFSVVAARAAAGNDRRVKELRSDRGG